MKEGARLQLDYQTTVDIIKMLTDIRFKLLAFIPTVAGLAVIFSEESNLGPGTVALGILGLVFTIGVALYDLRNSMIYDAAIHRAKGIEKKMGFTSYSYYVAERYQDYYKYKIVLLDATQRGGLFNERPSSDDLIKMMQKLDEAPAASPSADSPRGLTLFLRLLGESPPSVSPPPASPPPANKLQVSVGDLWKKGDPKSGYYKVPRFLNRLLMPYNDKKPYNKPRLTLWYFFPVWHDGALAVAYGAAVIGWSYIALASMLRYLPTQTLILPVGCWAILLASVLGLIFAGTLVRFSTRIAKVHAERPLKEDADEHTQAEHEDLRENYEKSLPKLRRVKRRIVSQAPQP